MNVTLPEKEKISKTRITVYIIIAIICVLAIAVVIGIEVLGNDIVDNFFGIDKLAKRTEQEEAALKANFDNLFKNQFENIDNYSTQKITEENDIIYTNYKWEEKTENYEIKMDLPFINIKNSTIQNFNKRLEKTYEKKAEEISQKSNNAIYTVKYIASIKNNILSIALYSDLKQDTSAQRVIIETFNFNLEEKKELTLEDIIKIYKLDKNEIQNKINNNIKEQQTKIEELKELGYNIFSRDINSKIYNIENITEYFIYDDNIYIVFAYGNEKITSEKDVVII